MSERRMVEPRRARKPRVAAATVLVVALTMSVATQDEQHWSHGLPIANVALYAGDEGLDRRFLVEMSPEDEEARGQVLLRGDWAAAGTVPRVSSDGDYAVRLDDSTVGEEVYAVQLRDGDVLTVEADPGRPQAFLLRVLVSVSGGEEKPPPWVKKATFALVPLD
jgi:hypothetical protein